MHQVRAGIIYEDLRTHTVLDLAALQWLTGLARKLAEHVQFEHPADGVEPNAHEISFSAEPRALYGHPGFEQFGAHRLKARARMTARNHVDVVGVLSEDDNWHIHSITITVYSHVAAEEPCVEPLTGEGAQQLLNYLMAHIGGDPYEQPFRRPAGTSPVI